MKVNGYLHMFKYNADCCKKNIYSYTPVAVLISAASIFCFNFYPAAAQDGVEYMFILKNGSNITAAADEKSLSDTGIKVIKIRTSYGELEIPRDEILKYYKSPINSPVVEKKTEKEPAEKEQEPEEAVEKTQKTAEVNDSEEIKTAAAPEKAPDDKTGTEIKTESGTAKTAKKEIEDEALKMDEQTDNETNIYESKKNATANQPKNTGAENLLNLDDDKLLDMLGESDIAPPEPVINTDTEKIGEIEKIRGKYQAQKGSQKKLIPDNLNSIEADIKSMAGSSTEEDWLIAKFTREIQVEKAETVPVEVIEVGVKNSENGEKSAADASVKDGTKEAGVNKKTGATLEVILSETEEARIIGGGKLSEKIVKEFKKHKALPHKKISEKQHLNAEIQKHFSSGENKKTESETAAETKEVKVEKK